MHSLINGTPMLKYVSNFKCSQMLKKQNKKETKFFLGDYDVTITLHGLADLLSLNIII